MPVDGKQTTTERPLTAAELVQKKTGQRNKRKRKKDESNVDLDDEIKRLEAELREMSDEQGSSSDSNDDDDGTGAIVALSTVKDDRIEALPASALPDVPPTHKKQRKTSKIDKKESKNTSDRPLVSQGLKDAVQEVLRGYKPRSAEHLPFYCRCCAKQYDNLEQFQAHKTTEFHKAAVELERKASFCRSCRKQLTSPAQLQEHLQSRPHKERLEKLKAKQRQRKRF